MFNKSLILKFALTLVGLGMAFWIGRTSSSNVPESTNSVTTNPKPSTRSARRSASNRSSSSDGKVIISTAQLRKQLKEGDSIKVMTSLSKMNTKELSTLAKDLSEAVKSMPVNMYYAEIQSTFSQWAESDPEAALKFALSSKQNGFKSQALQSIFQKLVKTDIDLANQTLASITDSSLRRSLQGTLYRNMATTQPDEWIKAMKADKSLSRHMGMGNIASQWAMDDPVAAAARVKQLPKFLQLRSVKSIAQIWGSKDSQAAMAWAQSFSEKNIKNQAVGAVIGGMALRDPAGAMSALDGVSPSVRKKGLSAIFQTLLSSDFDTAFTTASSLSDPADQKIAYEELLSNSNYYRRLNIEQITKFTNNLPNGKLRNKALGQLGVRLAEASPQDAEKFLKNYPEKEQIQIKLKMLSNMYYSDPNRAMAIYKSIPPAQSESYLFSSIINSMCKENPKAALDIVLKENPYEQARAIDSVFESFTKSDPQDAIKQLDSLPEGAVRKEALEAIAETWGETDSAAALQWAATLKEDEKNKAIRSILPKMAKNSPQDAADLLGGMMAGASETEQYKYSSSAYYLMNSWSQQDPAAASTWVLDLKDGPIKNSAIRELAPNWYKQDSNAVADWIEKMPQGKTRDASIRAISNELQRRDPETAFAWAESVGDDNSRMDALSRVVSSWKRYDKKKAIQTVEKANLSDKERASLLKSLDMPK